MPKFKINHGVPGGLEREVEAHYFEQEGELVEFVQVRDEVDKVVVLAMKIGLVQLVERVEE